MILARQERLNKLNFNIMMISSGFDLANQNRKKDKKERAIKTAKKLNNRIMLFAKDIINEPSFKATDKAEILKYIFKDTENGV
jgi:hypothetical protein